jgi:nucleoid DNA-binding protein
MKKTLNKKSSRHKEIVTLISKRTGIKPGVVSLCVEHFFQGLRKLMLKNKDINIFGLFKLTMKAPYRKKADAGINLRIRKSIRNK